MVKKLLITFLFMTLPVLSFSEEKGFFQLLNEAVSGAVEEVKQRELEREIGWYAQYKIPEKYFKNFEKLGKKVGLSDSEIKKFIEEIDECRRLIRTAKNKEDRTDEKTDYLKEIGITGREGNIQAISILMKNLCELDEFDREDLIREKGIFRSYYYNTKAWIALLSLPSCELDAIVNYNKP